MNNITKSIEYENEHIVEKHKDIKTRTTHTIQPIEINNYFPLNDNAIENAQNKLQREMSNYDLNEMNNYFTRIDENVISKIQKRLDKEKIKKSLDEFTMVRKKTHFTLPDFNTNDILNNPNSKQDVDLKYVNDFDKIAMQQNGIRTDFDYTDTYIETPDSTDYNIYPTYQEESRIINLLRKQTKIIKKIAETIENDTRRQHQLSDFDALMAEIEKKQEIERGFGNYTAFTFETSTKKVKTKSTTTEKPTTILTVFDEVEIRNALKNDPYVRRILKMANRKRVKYLQNARRLHARNNRHFRMQRMHNMLPQQPVNHSY